MNSLWPGYRVLQQALIPTAHINLTGLTLDTDAHEHLMAELEQKANALELELSEICLGAIDNHGSTAQVSRWIIEEILGEYPLQPGHLERFTMRLHGRTKGAVKSWRVTKTGHLAITKGSKGRKAEQLRAAFPTVSEYLIKHAQWTAATKLLDAFGPTLRRWQDLDGRVRGQHKCFGAWTGRQSCNNPNLQQMPREETFRALWVAKPGRKLVIADYDQVELRLLAIESGDEIMRQIYRDGRDVHKEVASIAFNIPLEAVTKELRRRAKAISFGIAYGSGASGLSEHGGFELDEARIILSRVLTAYPGLATYRERMPTEAERRGFIAIRPHRRVTYTKDSVGTTAINAPIQGGAASVQMRALRLVWDAIQERQGSVTVRDNGSGPADCQDDSDTLYGASTAGETAFDVQLAASVHDEIILDSSEECAEEAAELLVDAMTRALVELYPEAELFGLARLTAASVVNSWAQKP